MEIELNSKKNNKESNKDKNNFNKNQIIDNLNWRESTKIFDTNKNVSKVDLDIILNSARLSASSYGIEPWKFLVIENQELKNKIEVCCYNQKQISTSNKLIIALYRKDINTNSKYISELFENRIKNKDVLNMVRGYYDNYVKDKTQIELSHFSDKQNHIALGFVLSTLANLKIDSCPIGGFVEDDILKLLNIDKEKFGISYLLPIGYRLKNNSREKTRLELKKIVEYL